VRVFAQACRTIRVDTAACGMYQCDGVEVAASIISDDVC